jgi:large subunit ribosomal protein L18
MAASNKGKKLYDRRKNRVRTSIKKKSNGRIRLVVFRSNQHIYAQIINDVEGVTVAQSSTLEGSISSDLKSTCNIEAAKKVGASIAKKAKDANVVEVVFDRGAFRYHGKIKALADAARENGLSF